MVGVCLIVAVGASAIASATASAALPEIGRCEKVEGILEGKKTVYHGGYTNASCVAVSSTKTGKYEWHPGPGAKKGFSGSGGPATIETVGGQKITCTESISEGEITGAKTATVHLNLHQCSDPAVAQSSCQSSGNPPSSSEIASEPLEGEIGYIATAPKQVVGLDVKHSPNIAAFYCAKGVEVAVTGSLEGSVIAPFKQLNKMSTEDLLKYKATKGIQAPEKFEGGAKDTLVMNLINGLSKTTEQAGLSNELKLTTEEALEIKAK
jgi:hypothetical protein